MNRPTPHVGNRVDTLAVGLEPAIGDAEDELRLEDALEIDAVDDPLDRRQHLIGEVDLKKADTERAAATRQAEPAEEEAGELPERIEAEAARHDGVALEMAIEEPEVRLDVELGADEALAVLAAPLPRSR